MHLVSSSEGFALWLKTKPLQRELRAISDLVEYDQKEQKIIRLLKFAKKRLELALLSIPVLPPFVLHDRSDPDVLVKGFCEYVDSLGQG